MLSSPGCWHDYGLILAREYEDPRLFAAAHRFTVDAYALQHPGLDDEPRAFRSVWLHYISLHLIFEHGRSHRSATTALTGLAKFQYMPLPSAPPTFALTLEHVSAAAPSEHVQRVNAWARSAYEGWGELRTCAEDAIKRLDCS